MNIEQLKQQEKELLEMLSENNKKQFDLNVLAFIEKYGVNVGDTVQYGENKNIAKFIGWKTRYNPKEPKAIVSPFNTNGTVSKRQVELLSWDLDYLKKVQP